MNKIASTPVNTFNRFLGNKNIWLGMLSVLLAFIVYWVLPEDCPEAAGRTAFVLTIAAFF